MGIQVPHLCPSLWCRAAGDVRHKATAHIFLEPGLRLFPHFLILFKTRKIIIKDEV